MQLNQSGIKQVLEKIRGWCSEGENMTFGNLEDGKSAVLDDWNGNQFL